MPRLPTLHHFTAATTACAVTVPFAAALWLIGVPGTMSLVTFAAVSAITFGASYVSLNTWQNGQATRSVAHVINETEAKVRVSSPARGELRSWEDDGGGGRR